MTKKVAWDEYEFYRSEPPERTYDSALEEDSRLFDHSLFLKRQVWRNMRHFGQLYQNKDRFKPINKLHQLERGKL